jgi:alkylation response protein AidB-like acyl-CoA dehydrogenase/predicted heme/steroid binding protein
MQSSATPNTTTTTNNKIPPSNTSPKSTTNTTTFPQFTPQEVSKNNGKDGSPAWVIINGDVLDVTKFAPGHPAGPQILLELAGQDITKQFYALHRYEVLETRLERLKIGEIRGYIKQQQPQHWMEISKVPYAEIDMNNSPYWKDSHKRLRLAVRKFLWESGAYEWSNKAEVSGELPPRELIQKYGRSGLLALCAGKGELAKRIPEPNLFSECGIPYSEIDQFHVALMEEERARMMCPGAEDGMRSGVSIGLGPILHFGPKWMQGDLVQSIIMGNRVVCLAITEAVTGSDVAGVTCRAIKSADGSHYVVSGIKKWITNSVFADYFTTLVRLFDSTGKEIGLTMLLIEKSEGLTVKPIPTDYSSSAGTGLVIFENVHVPARNLLGTEGGGMRITMYNFNLERHFIIAMILSRSRRVIEQTFLWANQRETFGKKLIDQPVIRAQLGEMISHLESCYSQYEKLTYQYEIRTREQHAELGGPTALLKYRATRAATVISDNAVQIFGGRGITRTGMGKDISRFQKSFKFASVYGGSESTILDFAVRQAIRQFPTNFKL